ncbi:MAG: helix-turn-helix domain-containing protein [Acidihalobacter sp.]|uniref:helix-turn-helix domain-containing protein n=1 Tax=Acidihalobacter sp. TaxID=1872108 RepID=UPI00307CDC81
MPDMNLLNWALKQKTGSSSTKAVFMALALHAANADDPTPEVWPSVARISEITELNRKTVLSSLHALRDAGWISDTGCRVGDTRQVVVWRLAALVGEQSQKRDRSNSPNIGSLASKESQNRDCSNAKQSQKRDTEQKTVSSIYKYTNTTDTNSSDSDNCWSGVAAREREYIEHYVADRQKKRGDIDDPARYIRGMIKRAREGALDIPSNWKSQSELAVERAAEEERSRERARRLRVTFLVNYLRDFPDAQREQEELKGLVSDEEFKRLLMPSSSPLRTADSFAQQIMSKLNAREACSNVPA